MKTSCPLLPVAAVIALLVAGCAEVDAPADVAAEGVTSVCSDETGEGLGDVIPLAEIRDELGTYCRTTISPDSSALVYSVDKVDLTSVEALGFTEQDIINLIPASAEYLVEEVLDSEIIDRGDEAAFDAWNAANSSRFAEGLSLEYTGAPQPGLFNNDLPVLVRDGGARLTDVKIAFNGARGIEGDNGVQVLFVYFDGTAVYRINDESGIELQFQYGVAYLKDSDLIRSAVIDYSLTDVSLPAG